MVARLRIVLRIVRRIVARFRSPFRNRPKDMLGPWFWMMAVFRSRLTTGFRLRNRSMFGLMARLRAVGRHGARRRCDGPVMWGAACGRLLW